MAHEWRRAPYLITTDPDRLDLELVHAALADSYWAKGIPFETVKRSIENSLPFGLYQGVDPVPAGSRATA